MSLSRSCFALLVAFGCGSEPGVLPPPPPGTLQVLFIGNSLTYTNDLPLTVQSIAQSAGDPIVVDMEAEPNYALIDHLTTASKALTTLNRGPWDVVVLQQGPTPSGVCRDSLVLWTEMFDQRIKSAGAKTAVMMSWPASNWPNGFDEVRTSFQAAATKVNGTFIPVGEAWRSAWAEDASLELYGKDGFHPSSIGSFVAALTIYERLSGHDARTLPAKAFRGSGQLILSEEVIRALQRAAHDANSRFPAAPDVHIAPTVVGPRVFC